MWIYFDDSLRLSGITTMCAPGVKRDETQKVLGWNLASKSERKGG